jgi:hypothetical protein
VYWTAKPERIESMSPTFLRWALCGVLSLVLLTSLGQQLSLRAAGGQPAPGPFQAAIDSGPNKGLALAGTLHLHLSRTGMLTGQFMPARGRAVALSGQLSGAAINRVFYLGRGLYLFGTGTVGRDPETKQVIMGGTLVGPKQGDGGDWAQQGQIISSGHSLGGALAQIAGP